MKLGLSVLITLSLLSCSKTDLNGEWLLSLDLQGQTLPIQLNLLQEGSKLSGVMINSDEQIELVGTVKKNKFILNIGITRSVFEGELEGNTLKGNWNRTNRENYLVPFTGREFAPNKITLSHYAKYESIKTTTDFSGKWKVDLGNSFGLGNFYQKGSRIQGAILTSTGDYRYLDGYVSGGQVKLTGFDGTFSFLFDLKIDSTKFSGKYFAGNKFNSKILGTREKFELPDVNSMTELTHAGPLKLKLKDIEGNTIDIDSPKYAKMAKVVSVFGSWCPNCIDKTRFLIKWRNENPELAKKVAFFLVAFEKEETEKLAFKNLMKISKFLNLNFPLLIGSTSSTKDVVKIFPFKAVKAFPTTIFLDQDNKPLKVHTGFSGQATGQFFNQFKEEFQAMMIKMSATP